MKLWTEDMGCVLNRIALISARVCPLYLHRQKAVKMFGVIRSLQCFSLLKQVFVYSVR